MKVSFAPYPSIGRALSGINCELEDMNIITIDTRIIGIVIKVTLDIALNPNKFITAAIATNIKITISLSIFGKYISTKLSEKVLITKPEIVIKYTHTVILNIFFRSFPPVNSQISIISLPGKSEKTL